MTTDVTDDDLRDGADLAKALLAMLADDGTPPAIAACALAAALGRVCAQFGVDLAVAHVVVQESHRLGKAA